jgi:membrane protease YdiL (CAAX protease family)
MPAPVPPAVACALAGCAALAARPATVGGSLAVTVVVGAIGGLGPVPRAEDAHVARVRWRAATLLGVATVAAAHALRPPPVVHVAIPGLAVAALMAAAVAEEAFFRRFLYGWLAGGGPALAIVGTATVFAAVHIPAYGVRAFPIDFTAGLLFGWQRWATGGWTASALTHAAANLVQAT